MTYKGYLSVSIAILLLSFTTIQTTFDTPNRSSVISPTLSSPIDGAINVPLSPTFESSEALTNATIEIYEGNDFTLADNLDLDGYDEVDSGRILNTSNDISGVTYSPVTDSLYMISNKRPIAVFVTDLAGKGARKIDLNGFEDTEDIVHIAGNEFAIVEEKRGIVSFVEITTQTQSIEYDDIDMANQFQLSGLPDETEDEVRDGDGAEGVTFNPNDNSIYAITEDLLELHRFSRSDTDMGNTIIGHLRGSLPPLDFIDLSAIHHLGLSSGLHNLAVSNHFLLLSDDSHKLVETDTDFNYYGELNLPTPSQFEGVTMDSNGTIYLVSEPNLLYIYKNNNCNLSKVPTGRLVHQNNAVDGASYNLPIKLDHNTEYTWRIITDEGCSEFSSFRTMPLPCTITATQPIIDCNDNCTPNNLTDDKFTITVSATAENGSRFYTVNDGTTTSQPVAYGAAIELGPYFTDITADIELTFADAANPDCNTTVMILRLPCSTSLEATVSSSINSDNEDAYEANDGTMNLNSTTIQLGQINGAGLIFRNPGIPQGATILYAIAQFSAGAISTETTSSETTTLMISADKNSSARVFSTFNNDITNRPMVSQRVQWEVDPWNVGQRDAAQQTPDISALLQEIVDRRSFNENSNIGIIISGTGNRVIQTHESGAGQAATLIVKYTTNTCPPVGTPCGDSDRRTNKRMQNGECCCIDCPPSGTSCDDGNSNTINDMYDENCVCMGVDSLPVIDISFSIDSSEDDVEENGRTGRIDAGNDKITMVRYSGRGNQSIGLRFTNISIPRGSTISMAELEFVAENDNNRDGILMIYAEDVNNSTPFDRSDRRNVSSRAKTSGIAWNHNSDSNWTSGEKYLTDNIAPIIQELIDRDDWVGDSVAITIIIEGTGRRVAKSFDDSSENAPSLHIKYTNSTNITNGTQRTNSVRDDK